MGAARDQKVSILFLAGHAAEDLAAKDADATRMGPVFRQILERSSFDPR